MRGLPSTTFVFGIKTGNLIADSSAELFARNVFRAGAIEVVRSASDAARSQSMGAIFSSTTDWLSASFFDPDNPATATHTMIASFG
jgi:hypothetical protein